MKILVSIVCFINDRRLDVGSIIYATYANRLINDVVNNTDFDVRVATNRPELFAEAVANTPDRVNILAADLSVDVISPMNVFNYLLKLYALRDVPAQYDWVLYLDCDAGLPQPVTAQQVANVLQFYYDAQVFPADAEIFANRTESMPRYHIGNYEATGDDLFAAKFLCYGYTSENFPKELLDCPLPSEHFLLLKNTPGKLQKMSVAMEQFNDRIMALRGGPRHADCLGSMSEDAFEIGLAAGMAGMKMWEAGGDLYVETLHVEFNGNAWERIKL